MPNGPDLHGGQHRLPDGTLVTYGPLNWSGFPDHYGAADVAGSVVSGGDGDDMLWGEEGDNTLLGEGDNDWLVGGSGADTLDGGAGDDVLIGYYSGGFVLSWDLAADGFDKMSGGPGDDAIFGNENDEGHGGAGNDTVYIGDGGVAFGDDGNDRISVGADAIADGGAGDDTIDVGDNSYADGGDGDDQIFSNSAGVAFLNGGEGDDFLYGGAGSVLDGGDGLDTASVVVEDDDPVDIDWTSAGGSVQLGGVGLTNIEVLNLTTGAGDDSLSLHALAPGFYSWWAGDGSDHVSVDLSSLAAGATLRPSPIGPQSELADIGDVFGGFNLVVNASFSVSLQSVEAFSIRTGAGGDDLVAGAGDDVLDTGAGDDRLDGGAGVDMLIGGDGRDEIRGGDGPDVLIGGALIPTGEDIDDHARDDFWGGDGADSFIAGDGDFIHDIANSEVIVAETVFSGGMVSYHSTSILGGAFTWFAFDPFTHRFQLQGAIGVHSIDTHYDPSTIQLARFENGAILVAPDNHVSLVHAYDDWRSAFDAIVGPKLNNLASAVTSKFADLPEAEARAKGEQLIAAKLISHFTKGDIDLPFAWYLVEHDTEIGAVLAGAEAFPLAVNFVVKALTGGYANSVEMADDLFIIANLATQNWLHTDLWGITWATREVVVALVEFGLVELIEGVESLVASMDAGQGTDNADVLAQNGEETIYRPLGGADTVSDGAGDATVLSEADAANDVFSGGAGFDELQLFRINAGANVNLATGVATGAGMGVDSISGFEAVLGGGGDDVLVGDAFANRLAGDAGDDTLIGAGGADTLVGGAGADHLTGGSGVDIANYVVSSTAASWTRHADGSWSVDAGGEGMDALFGVEILHFTDRDVHLDIASRTFSGDGTSDILFRRNDGIMASWEVTGTTINAAHFLPTAGAEWTPRGSGDFNGDGRADVLWQRDDGLVYTWQMNGGGVEAANALTGVGNEWTLRGVGDFDGDLDDDIVWQRNDGIVYLWNMQNGAIQSAQFVAGLGPEWSYQGSGDFNGDGRDDFLWRNTSGQTYIWNMNGATISSSGATSVQAGNEWEIAGIGDANGDGYDDIILHRASDGMVRVWSMNGTSVFSSTDIAAVNPAQWQIHGVGDYNGDGRDDILWQNSDGLVYVWLLNGATITGAGGLSGVGAEWSIVGGG